MPFYVDVLIALAVVVVPALAGGYLARMFRMPDYGWKIGVMLCALFAGTMITVRGWPPKLGIDLSGGVILVYEVDQQAQAEAQGPVDMDNLIAAVSRRVNPGGVREVSIVRYGPDQIEIIIPEADEAETERIKKKISSIGALEFRIVANRTDHADLIDRADDPRIRELRNEKGEPIARWVPIRKEMLATYGGALPASFASRVNERGDTEILVVTDAFNVTGAYLKRAYPDQRLGRPSVSFVFDQRGAQLFGALTSENLPDPASGFERNLSIILDGYVQSAPSIQSAIYDQGEITGNFTQEQVEDLVAILNAGSLPAALNPEPNSQAFIGPILGADTIRKGQYSMVVSMALVLLFMAVYYRFSGVVACFALLLNLVLLLAVMITIKAAFTLPGLAGLVLTVGMAVDANVLIYERIREEIDRGAALRMAIRNGFSRATTTIVDANLTTLITATVLYAIGTDQVKGFAVTLWLGIVISMFTSIFCARIFFDIAERKRWLTRLSMMRFLRQTEVDFVGKRFIGATASIIAIVVGMVGVSLRGANLLDIDFTGGTSVQVQFAQDHAHNTGAVRQAVGDQLPDLAISEVIVADEPRGLRFMINTSERDVDVVQNTLRKTFPGELATNSLSFGQAAVIESGGAAGNGGPSGEETDEGPPAADGQSRRDAAAAALLAMADAQDPPPADEPADEPAAEAPRGADAAQPPTETKPTAQGPPALPTEPMPRGVPPTTPAQPDQQPTPEQTTLDVFEGGTRVSVTFDEPLTHDSLSDLFNRQFPEARFEFSNPGYTEGSSAPFREWDVKITATPAETERGLEAIKAELVATPHFPSSTAIGEKVAGATQVQAVYAILASLLFIVAYIWVRFQRVAYGLAAVVALVHDVLITLGALALSAYVAGFAMMDTFKISLPIVAAFLTIIGYSLNDTIVVFDRIREVRGKSPNLTPTMINLSINQTLSRTLLTSFTTFIVVIILYFFGGQGIHGFAFSLVVGVVVGTYSSIFVASPILLLLSRQSFSTGSSQASTRAA